MEITITCDSIHNMIHFMQGFLLIFAGVTGLGLIALMISIVAHKTKEWFDERNR